MDCTCKCNCAKTLTYIIPLNTNGNYDCLPQGSKILDAEITVDYYVGRVPSESEGNLFDDTDAPLSPISLDWRL